MFELNWIKADQTWINLLGKEELGFKVSFSQYQNSAILLVDIQILIVFYTVTWQEKETIKLGTSLLVPSKNAVSTKNKG